MSTPLPTDTATNGTAAAAPRRELALEDVFRQLDSVRRENEALGRDLLRCYEQLSLVFEITGHIANLHEPADVEAELLKRYAVMLDASAVYLVAGGTVRRIELPSADPNAPNFNAAELARLLETEIESVRTSGHTAIRPISEPMRGSVPPTRFVASTPGGAEAAPAPHCHALLGALRRHQGETAVVIALRGEQHAPFDSGDLLASESALGYGSHILSNMMMLRHLQQMAFETICALVRAIEKKDNYTSGHSERVGWLAKLTGVALGLPDPEIKTLEWAGLLHDVGKIGVPEAILNKPGKLSPEEWEIMKRHPRMSYEVLKPVRSLEGVLGGVLHHHENHDGSGYPEGLAGEQIPPHARIIHVVDIFDALTSSRSYRKGFSLSRAFSILADGVGAVTEPHVTRTFIEAFKRYMAAQPEDFARRFCTIPVEEPRREEAGGR